MSGLEELFGICGACFLCCCCFEGLVQRNNFWCFMSCCNGSRYRVRGTRGGFCSCKRAMDDADFERTVEELYSTSKPVDISERSTHLVELQAVRRGDSSRRESGGDGDRQSRAVDTQPRRQASMEAPRRSRERSRSPMPVPLPEGEIEREREQAMLESRKDAKDRTRDWVAAHGQSSSTDIARPPSAYNPSRAHRPHRSEPTATPSLRPSDSQSQRQRPPSDAGRDRDGGLDDEMRGPPRLDIPTSLKPGAPRSAGPAQLPFDLGPAQSSTQAQAPSRSGSRDDHSGEGQRPARNC
ncbi:hypothetical protein L226DRAFT_612342 [Lentinus tigrinus ALCF2SS1-7]|uniref:Uncharacterized protein n=1 Tax=Lentinus tigrinus ALCF2SS1-6 TaxID=1328759 RepID=A0A5C2SEH2_9APHY|nr:hypothetical protein L227DRAFT_574142 [Lentinus tigrinus ALCF2SS1-6]RPD76103.1 hypothetical protein L226DRAFT_612342 [Lentinus tigrinus ALCF2SS1-7]